MARSLHAVSILRGRARRPPARTEVLAVAIGLVVVGLGDVGSSLVAGVEASRAHLVHPWGSLVEAGGAGRTPEAAIASPLRDAAPLAELTDLVLGAFELKDDDAYRAAVRAGLVGRSLLDELRPRLRQIRAMSGARQAPTRRHLADAIAEDLRGFLEHGGCARGVVLCTVPGPRQLCGKPAFNAAEIWAALEDGAIDVTPGLVYAAAAAQAGWAFVAAAPDPSLESPGVAALFEEAGQPVAGVGLLAPDAALREALVQMFGGEALGLAGATSLTTRVEERGAQPWNGPDRTQEIGLASGWAGGALELCIELRGHTALHLAARALDAALLVELAARAGRSGAQGWMEAIFAAPMGTGTPRQAQPCTLAERRARMIAELPALAAAAADARAA